MSSIFDYEVKTIDGEIVTLERFKGKVIMIVNVASKCGFTSQYTELEELYKKYKDEDFVILGFPANNFMNQEPGNDEDIKSFCSLNYGVTFPMFSKISVKGEDINPLYSYLTEKETNPDFHGKIGWNFTKFIIDKNGKIVHRFKPITKPNNKKIVKAIELLIKEGE